MAGKLFFQQALHKPYELGLFTKDILRPIFGNRLRIYSSSRDEGHKLNATEKNIIAEVKCYGELDLDDGSQLLCYEIILQPKIRLEHNRVSIQQYLRKIIIAGQAILVNFKHPDNNQQWRLSLVASDSKVTEKGIEQTKTNARRYTYLLGPSEICRTAAERFEELEVCTEISIESLTKAFSVEKLSKTFFDEYKIHYEAFVEYLNKPGIRKAIFSGDEKGVRDFAKKTLGRIVFLYFVQKKGWLGASNTEYHDGNRDFIMSLFKESGGNEDFYSVWLNKLFFDTLNAERKNDDFRLPGNTLVKIPFLNGGLFEQEDYDEALIAFPAKLFHNKKDNETPKERGFLDFLNAYNFTIYEDSPDEHTIAVDPEMLGHIFENLLEDNKDKGAFYTPKEIVHYMCQESLIEYLVTHLSKDYTVYKQLGKNQVEMFGNETKKGQLTIVEALGDRALDHAEVEAIVKTKDISVLTNEQLKKMDMLLDKVKICDPAIGSGAFPMGLLQEIYAIKQAISLRIGKIWDGAKVKAAIIQNSIYGVDIEKGAVDIARLRFWLSLVVDENKPKPLPNLDYKIVVGNSLISKFEDEIVDIDWKIDANSTSFAVRNLTMDLQAKIVLLKTKQHAYFFHKDAKYAIQHEIRDLKIDILALQLKINKTTYGLKNAHNVSLMPTASDIKKNLEHEMRLAGFDKLLHKLEALKKDKKTHLDFFDWELSFPEVMGTGSTTGDAGFDIVIGNPPYIQMQKDGGALSEMLKNCKYETFTRTGDIYCIFYELGFNILKNNGVLTYITSNKWMRAAYGKILREYFITKTNPLKLIDFGGFQVFETATVDTNILIGQKTEFKNEINTCVLGKGFSIDNMSDYFRQHSSINSFTNNSWVVLADIEKGIKQKIEAIGVPLKDWDVKINYGIKTGFNEAFIISTEKREEILKKCPKADDIIRPILRGRDIEKYRAAWQELYVIGTFPSLKLNIDDYPAIKKYLLSFGIERLEQSGAKHKLNGEIINSRKKTGNNWFETQDQIGYWQDFDKPKIVWKRIGSVLRFCYDETGVACLDSTCFATGADMKFLVGYLNSSMSKWNRNNKFINKLLKHSVLPLLQWSYITLYNKFTDLRI